MRIYVIRHGETEANAAGVFQGQTNGQLTGSGFALAREVGEAMTEVRFDIAFSSPLDRAMHTARTVLEASGNLDTDIRVDNRLLEVDMGNYEGKRFRPGESEVDAELCNLFFEDPFTFPGFPGGEDVYDVCNRTQEFLSWLCDCPFDSVLVSTHGFALRAMLNGLYENPQDFWQGRVPYNCSLSILEATTEGIQLIESDVVLYDKTLCVDHYSKY